MILSSIPKYNLFAGHIVISLNDINGIPAKTSASMLQAINAPRKKFLWSHWTFILVSPIIINCEESSACVAYCELGVILKPS